MSGADGLMAFYADFDDQDVEAFRQWHNCEHMAERVSIPGFLRGRRYRGVDRPATFLMTYETETAAVLSSTAYHAALNAPTPWTKEALTWFRAPARAIYSKRLDVGGPMWRPAPYLVSVRFNMGDRSPQQPEAIHRLLAAGVDAGTARARFYELDEAISGMMTAERQIYSGGPGQQQFLAIVQSMEPFEDAVGLPGPEELSEQGASDVFVDRFTLDFALEAPR